MSNILMKWLVIAASILWAAIVIDRAVIEPGTDDNATPVIEAGKNCTSEDMHQRYECAEAAILTHQREKFVRYIGLGLLLFGPPIGLWLGMNRLSRNSVANLRPDRRPPSIRKWRVR
jgi:hypothetical protein